MRASPRAQAHLATGSSVQPLRVASAAGVMVVDDRGREHVDMLSGWCVANLGWSHPDIRRRLRRFEGPGAVSPHHEYAPWVELASRLVDVTPGELSRVYRATGGSEAVDLALQAAMIATRRRKLVALQESYHGNTLAGLAASGDAPSSLRWGARQLKPPFDEKALPRLETALKGRDVAAFILEPIPINLGVEIPTAEFMDGARRLCSRYGTLLVLDEVATGFGRTGALFATEHYDVAPDILCLAKAITSGAAPLGAMLMTDAVAKKAADDMHSYSTYGWHPLGVEAALANLDVWERDRAKLLQNAEARGQQVQRRVEEMELGNVRRKGLAIAVDMKSGKEASRLVERARQNGALLGASGRTLQLFPPLVITQDEVETALVAIERAL